MKFVQLVPMLAALLIIGCNNDAGESASAPATANDPAGPAAEQPVAPPANGDGVDVADWQRVVVTGVTCGDNCYLEFQASGLEDTQTALCMAPLCAEWFEAQALPDAERGAAYDLRMTTTGAQVDAAGSVMDDAFPLITEIRPAP